MAKPASFTFLFSFSFNALRSFGNATGVGPIEGVAPFISVLGVLGFGMAEYSFDSLRFWPLRLNFSILLANGGGGGGTKDAESAGFVAGLVGVGEAALGAGLLAGPKMLESDIALGF